MIRESYPTLVKK